MAGTKISEADYTAARNLDYTNTDAHSDQTFSYSADLLDTAELTKDEKGNFTYQCEWSKWFGYYATTSELQAIIIRKTMWTVGKGYEADKKTKAILDRIRGNGKDTFDTLMGKGVITYSIGGDFYAEIIKKREAKTLFLKSELVNLKPLNPGTIKIIADKFGMIKKYEQWIDGKIVNSFDPEEIFHLSWKPVADQIHGNGIAHYEKIIKARNEVMGDLKTIFHRYVKPLLIISVDSDDTAELAAFKVKVDKALELSENLIVPKATVDSIDKVSIPKYSTLDPMPWVELLQKEFIKTEGVPLLVQGVGGTTSEAESKVLYLCFQQVIEYNQLFLEQQIKAQLGLDVKFNFPISLEPNIKAGEKRDNKPNDANVGVDSHD